LDESDHASEKPSRTSCHGDAFDTAPQPWQSWRMATTKAPRIALHSLCLALVVNAAALANDIVVSLSPVTGAVLQYHLQLPQNFFVSGASYVDADRLIYLVAESPLPGSTPPVYQTAVYSLDPATLAFIQIAVVKDLSFQYATYDPASHSLLAVDGLTLYSIDPHSGATNTAGTVPVPNSELEITDISIGADGLLYALYYNYTSSQLGTYLVRFDRANAQAPVNTTLNPAYGALRGLVPIPGTTAFYASTGFNPLSEHYTGPAPAFGILDASTFTFTTLSKCERGSIWSREAPAVAEFYVRPGCSNGGTVELQYSGSLFSFQLCCFGIK
jgi:hypothetical protein